MELEDLIFKYKKRKSDIIFNKIYAKIENLLKSLARKKTYSEDDFDDYISIGNVVLIESIDAYSREISKMIKFSAFFYKRFEFKILSSKADMYGVRTNNKVSYDKKVRLDDVANIIEIDYEHEYDIDKSDNLKKMEEAIKLLKPKEKILLYCRLNNMPMKEIRQGFRNGIIVHGITLHNLKEKIGKLMKTNTADTLIERKFNLEGIDSKFLTLAEMEKIHIRKALEYFEWKYTDVAKALGISQKTLYTKRKIYNLKKEHIK